MTKPHDRPPHIRGPALVNEIEARIYIMRHVGIRVLYRQLRNSEVVCGQILPTKIILFIRQVTGRARSPKFQGRFKT